MTRRRWLPEGVTEWRDRHGKPRYRWRKAGHKTHNFKAKPGAPEFIEELAACVSASRSIAPTVPVIRGSVRDLCQRLYATTRWQRLDEKTRAVYRGELDRFCAKHGDRLIKDATVADLDRILAKMADTPSAANNLRKRLKMLFHVAVKLGWRTDNPAAATDKFDENGSYHTWTDAEIEQFRSHHPLGSKARLAMELALGTAARRCNIASLTRSQLQDGCFHIQHVKGNEATIVPAMPETLDAIEAMAMTGIGHFLVTKFGKPYSDAGLGNAFRDWCNEAGLPHCSMHGLRKAQSRRLAESGATDAQGRAVTGHKKDSTFAYYAKKANRKVLAAGAVANLVSRNLANHPEKDG